MDHKSILVLHESFLAFHRSFLVFHNCFLVIASLWSGSLIFHQSSRVFHKGFSVLHESFLAFPKSLVFQKSSWYSINLLGVHNCFLYSIKGPWYSIKASLYSITASWQFKNKLLGIPVFNEKLLGIQKTNYLAFRNLIKVLGIP